MRPKTLARVALATVALAGGASRLLAAPAGAAHTVRDVCKELEPQLAPVEAKRAEAIRNFCKAHAADQLTKAKSEELLRLTTGLTSLQVIVARFPAPVEAPVR